LIRLYGLTNTIEKQLCIDFEAYGNTQTRTQWHQYAIRLAAEIGAVVFIALVIIAGIFVLHVPVGSLIAFLAIFYRLIPRVLNANSNLMAAGVELRMLYAWKERLTLIESMPEKDRGDKQAKFCKEIKFSDLSLTYPGSSRPTLCHINFSLPLGKMLALTGSSGSGKTSIVDLLVGLFQPTSGQILVDDVSLSSISKNDWQKQLGVVEQHSMLLHGTVLQNIAWGDPTPLEERAWQAAEAAQAAEFIQNLPKAMQTIIGQGALQLSGGQIQRIAIARALYRKPKLLILDEATSALDAKSESIIAKTIENLKGSCTILMISHRLSTVQCADQILLLESGKITESGTWSELMNSTPGRVRKLAQLQGLL